MSHITIGKLIQELEATKTENAALVAENTQLKNDYNQLNSNFMKVVGERRYYVEACFDKNVEIEKLRTWIVIFRTALEFYADRNNWKCWDSHSECKDVITVSDLGVKSYNEKADYAIPSGGRLAREMLSKYKE